MSKRARVGFILSLVYVAMVVLAGSTGRPEAGEMPSRVTIAGGPMGTPYYVIAAGIARIMKVHLGMDAVAETSRGGAENNRLVGRKRATFGLTGADGIFNAVHGLEEYKARDEKYEGLRAVTAGHYTTVHVVTLERSGIRSIRDLRGKRVMTGLPASATPRLAAMLLELHGVKPAEVKQQMMSYVEAVGALRDGNIDAAFIQGAEPVAQIVDLASSHQVRLISLEKAVLDAITRNTPYWVGRIIKRETYKTQEDALQLTVRVVLTVHQDTDDGFVYRATKALFENVVTLREMHPAGREWSLEDAAAGVPVPFHPGAERYLREKGILK